MGYIVGCLMAGLSFLLNRRLLQIFGEKTIVSYSPAVEEAAKTLLPYYLGADILASHITFGVIEGIYHWRQDSYPGAKGAVFSIGGHSAFGLLTIGCLHLSGSVWFGLAAGLFGHLLWNITVIRRFSGLNRS